MRNQRITSFTILGWFLLIALSVPTATAGDTDCDNNGILDQNELAGNDCDGDGVLDVCQNETIASFVEISGSTFSGDDFNYGNVDIDGRYVAVGDPGYEIPGDQGFGRVLIYRYDASTGWSQQQQINSPDNRPFYSGFGEQVVIRGNRLVVTMPGRLIRNSNDVLAMVYTYGLVDGVWVLQHVLESPFVDVEFGQTIALEGGRLFVQAAASRFQLFNGRLMIYREGENGWELEQIIYNGSTEDYAEAAPGRHMFGVSGNRLVTFERRVHNILRFIQAKIHGIPRPSLASSTAGATVNGGLKVGSLCFPIVSRRPILLQGRWHFGMTMLWSAQGIRWWDKSLMATGSLLHLYPHLA